MTDPQWTPYQHLGLDLIDILVDSQPIFDDTSWLTIGQLLNDGVLTKYRSGCILQYSIYIQCSDTTRTSLKAMTAQRLKISRP